jgi:superfamily II DNA or RNA helicase
VEKIVVDIKKKDAILLCSPHILKLVRERFSIKNPVYQMRRFADRVYALTPSGVFQIGLWNDIEHFLRSLNIQLEITLTDAFKSQYKPITAIDKISYIDGYTYYDYQIDSIWECIKNGRGICMLATGAGKSLLQAGLCKSFIDTHPDYKILVVVPNTLLLNQLYDSFKNEFGISSVTRWGDNNSPDLSANILIANNQILTSNISNTLTIVQNFDVVIVDEVHRIGDKKTQIGKVIANIPTPHKFGFTGTLPDEKITVWNVIGKIGPILYEKNSYDIRKKGTITDIEVNVVICKHKNPPIFVGDPNIPTDLYNQEFDYIMNLQSRNDIIRKIVGSLSGNILVIVDRLDYGANLLAILSSLGRKTFFISGDTSTEERQRIIQMMETENGIITIAMSTIFSTGLSVNNLHYALFTYIGKSNVKIVQSIGRTVRKHDDKNKAVVFDISDNLKYSFKHLRDRMAIYKEQKIAVKTITINI